MATREKRKLRDLGMVFKQSFKYLKKEKINVILKLETSLYQNINIISSYSIFIERFRLKQKKSGLTV